MSNKIEHSGVVQSIEDDCVHVRILQTSACAACKVAGHCNAAEAKEKVVDVYHADVRDLKVGDAVMVATSGAVAGRALLWGFGIPFVVMVGALLIVRWLSADEGIAALAGIAALLPYYLMLYLFRGRLREQLSFTIEKSR